MVGGGQSTCPTFKPSKEAFSRPFSDFVSEVLREKPDVGMFKVIPPKGWSPRKSPMPKLEDVSISCPIRQHVFGKQGAYRCYLVEQKKTNAKEFEKLCEKEGAAVAPKDRRGDDYRERAFWSSVTIRAPCYGADTPQSFFEEDVAYGWNLRNLGDLLKQYPVPSIPGVTYPMTYFGMWKAFFAWHVEDADLYSINYMHFGVGKVWYCVSPEERNKFNQMAESIFPDLHRECKSFMRHKDILLSPHVLRSYGIKYTQTKQEPGEFIVLNAGAYHSGFSLGFNCAEAVNFAIKEWLPMGAIASRCTCKALRDSVRISMDVFEGPTICERKGKTQQSSKGKKRPQALKEPEPSSKRKLSTGSTKIVFKAPLNSSKTGKKSKPSRSSDNSGVLAPATPMKKQPRKPKPSSGSTRARKETKTPGLNVHQRVLVSPKGKSSRSGARSKHHGSENDSARTLPELGENTVGREDPPQFMRSISPDLQEPMAVVGENKATKTKYFYMVLCLRHMASSVIVQWLKESRDGLFRLTTSVWEEDKNALLRIRTQWIQQSADKSGGYKLLTLRSRILETELCD